MEIDLTPVLGVVIDLLAAALMALGGWALSKLGRNTKEQARKRSEDIAHIEVRSKLVAEASNYVIERVPDAIARFGLDRERIEKLVESRLAGA